MTKRHALTALMMVAALPMAACGDDDEASGGSGPSEVAIEVSSSGKELAIKAPKSVDGGVARIKFDNASKKEAAIELVRIEGDHSAKEVRAAGEGWGDKGKALPAWLRLAGGSGNLEPGKSAEVTQALPEGKYVAFDLESDSFAEFEVTGDNGESLPATSARIDAVDYGFSSSGLKAGKNTITFENKGKEPHFVVGLPIKPGKTIEDVKKFAQTEKGEPPVDEKNGPFATAIVDGGVKQTIEVELKKGKYAFLCFIPDRKGGPPHVAKGMVSEAVVE